MVDKAIIIGAGRGSRMNSNIPKVLEKMCGISLLELCVHNAKDCKEITAVVSQEMLDNYKAEMPTTDNIQYCVQEKQLGTGDAVLSGVKNKKIEDDETIAILYADTPFINRELIQKAENKIHEEKADIVIIGFELNDNNKYGKLILDDKRERVLKIQEDIDAGGICNSGFMLLKGEVLKMLDKVKQNEKTKEFYLTELVEIATREKKKATYLLCEERDAMGVNSQEQLQIASKELRRRICLELMKKRIKIADIENAYIDFKADIGENCVIGQGVIIGKDVKILSNSKIGAYSKIESTSIGNDCEIESYVEIKNSNIKSKVLIKSFSYIDSLNAEIGCKIGPFARIREEVNLSQNVKIGNFAEIKNSTLKEGVKMGHFGYIGDAEVGAATNIGAGTVTANYNGKEKSKTNIGEEVFIGCQNTIVAPITIPNRIYTGANEKIDKNINIEKLKPNDLIVNGQIKEGGAKNKIKEGIAEEAKKTIK